MSENAPISNIPPSVSVTDRQKIEQLSSRVDEVQASLEKSLSMSQEKMTQSQKDIDILKNNLVQGINSIAEAKSLVYLGFIILIMMMVGILIDVAINIWGKNNSQAQSQPQIIYEELQS